MWSTHLSQGIILFTISQTSPWSFDVKLRHISSKCPFLSPMSDYSTPAASDFTCLPAHTIVKWHILALITFPLSIIPFCSLLEQFLTNEIFLVHIYIYTHTHTHVWCGYKITGLTSEHFLFKRLHNRNVVTFTVLPSPIPTPLHANLLLLETMLQVVY